MPREAGAALAAAFVAAGEPPIARIGSLVAAAGGRPRIVIEGPAATLPPP